MKVFSLKSFLLYGIGTSPRPRNLPTMNLLQNVIKTPFYMVKILIAMMPFCCFHGDVMAMDSLKWAGSKDFHDYPAPPY